MSIRCLERVRISELERVAEVKKIFCNRLKTYLITGRLMNKHYLSIGCKITNGGVVVQILKKQISATKIANYNRFDADYDSLAVKVKNGDEECQNIASVGKELKGYAKDAAKQIVNEDDEEEDGLDYKSKNKYKRVLNSKQYAVYYS